MLLLRRSCPTDWGGFGRSKFFACEGVAGIADAPALTGSVPRIRSPDRARRASAAPVLQALVHSPCLRDTLHHFLWSRARSPFLTTKWVLSSRCAQGHRCAGPASPRFSQQIKSVARSPLCRRWRIPAHRFGNQPVIAAWQDRVRALMHSAGCPAARCAPRRSDTPASGQMAWMHCTSRMRLNMVTAARPWLSAGGAKGLSGAWLSGRLSRRPG